MHRTFAAQDQDALPDEHLRIPASDSAEVEKAFLVDVGDLETDFVDMAGEHHPRFSLWVQDGHRVAMHVGADVVGEASDLFAPNAARRLLKTRRPRRVEQLL